MITKAGFIAALFFLKFFGRNGKKYFKLKSLVLIAKIAVAKNSSINKHMLNP